MHFQGAIIGLASFLIIGLFHPIVIKTEYHIGKKAWPVFLLVGVGLTVLSFFIKSTLLSAIVAVFAFSSSFRSIKELFEQEQRVKKGWFPANPKKKKAPEQRQGEGQDQGNL